MHPKHQRSKDCKNNQIILRNGNPSTVKTKFFGVAGGRVQFEDCLFDGVESPEVLFIHKLINDGDVCEIMNWSLYCCFKI